MESLAGLLAFNLALACAVMACVWVISLPLKDVSIVDIAWGAMGALLALSSFILANGMPARKLLITAMTVVWGGRLAFHIGRRKWGEKEDFRYAAMRAERPKTFAARSLVTIFLFQALLIWIVTLPAQVAPVSYTHLRAHET